MSAPDLEERLVRAPDLSIHLRPNGTATIWTGVKELSVGSHVLALLHAFQRPRSIRDVIDTLPVAGSRDFVDMTTALFRLREAGALVPPDGPLPVATSSGFDGSPIHVRMLRDERRTKAFLNALQEVVRPDDVVLDIGTGTGVLAVAAARAGARKVYAVEAGSVAAQAEGIIRANGVADRVEVVRGWSTQIQLPEPCSLLVTEILGDEPLGERLLDVVLDARMRLLAPGARVIPAIVRVMGELVSFPPEVADRCSFTSANLDRFREAYGIDFAFASRPSPTSSFLKFSAEEGRCLERRSKPFLLAEVDLTAPPAPRFEARVDVPCSRGGDFDGILLHFQLDLTSRVQLDTHPLRVDGDHHWQYACWRVGGRAPLTPGEIVRLVYTYVDGLGQVDVVP